MKSLKQHIKDNESSLISLNEKLIINRHIKNIYNYYPTSFKELQQIIEDKGDKLLQTEYYLDLSDIDTSKVDEFVIMHSDKTVDTIFDKVIVGHLRKLDVSGWKTSHITNMRRLFSSFGFLKEIIGLEAWDVSNVTDMSEMFCHCEELEKINIDNWQINAECNLLDMFDYCPEKLKDNISELYHKWFGD